MNQVENELQETVHEKNHTLVVYMEQLKKAYRDAGLVVPFMHNEKGMRSMSWSTDYQDVGGSVNLYGLDSYPGGQSCTNPNTGFRLVRNYHEWFANYSSTQPGFQPEFQAGWFSPWGGTFYDECPINSDPSFADVYYKNNVGQRVTLLNLYMGFGGTNWGHSAAPVVSLKVGGQEIHADELRFTLPTTTMHHSRRRGRLGTASDNRSYSLCLLACLPIFLKRI